MLQISYRAISELLSDYYYRSGLSEFISDTDSAVFKGSLYFAKSLEYYEFPHVMEEGIEKYDQKYMIFYDRHEFEWGIVLEIGQKYSISDMAILAHKCTRIENRYFRDIVESQAENKRYENNVEKCLEKFDLMINILQGKQTPVQVKASVNRSEESADEEE